MNNIIDPTIKIKANALSSLMKNKDISKALQEALNEPIGSTKRKKASSILKSVLVSKNRQSGIQDGKGGPGDANTMNTFYGSNSSYSPAKFTPESLRKTPVATPNEPMQSKEIMSSVQPQTTQPTKKSFVKTIDSFVAGDGRYKAPGVTETIKNYTEGDTSRLGRATNVAATYAGEFKNLPRLAVQEGLGWADFAAGNLGRTVKNAYSNLGKGIKNTYNNLTGSIYDTPNKLEYTYPDLKEPDTPIWNWGKDLLGYDGSAFDSTNIRSQVAIDIDPETGEPAIVDASTNADGGEMTDEDKTSIEESNYNKLANMTDEDRAAFTENLNPQERAELTGVLDAVAAGIGPKTWSFKARTSANILKGLGLPQEFIDNMPKTGLLSEQLVDLKDSIKAEFNLDSQLDRLNSLQSQGLNINQDFTSYIRGKDEYLTKIDSMIDVFDDIPTSGDPAVQKRNEMYGNYLVMLKGRQTQRYAGFVENAVNEHQTKIENAQRLYETSFKNAAEEFENMSAITTEGFNSLDSMLQEMYTNVESRKETDRDAIRFQQEVAESNAKLLNLAFQNQKLSEEISGVANGQTGFKLKDYGDEQMRTAVLNISEDDFGNINFQTLDPEKILNNAMQVSNIPSGFALQKFNLAVCDKIAQEVAATGDQSQTAEEYKKYWIELMEKAIEQGLEKNNPPLFDILNNAFVSASKSLNNTFRSSNRKFLTDSGNVSELRSAMKDLQGGGPGGPFEEKDRAKFIKKYKSKLGDLARVAFDFHVNSIAAGMPEKKTFETLLVLDDTSMVNTFLGQAS